MDVLETFLETLAATGWFIAFTVAGIATTCLCFFLLLTPYWWLSALYLCWLYLDRNICEGNGRRIVWMENWSWWKYSRRYFRAKLLLDPTLHLDESKNYLFCGFPHGVMCCGIFHNLITVTSEFRQRYPNLNARIHAAKLFFYVPFVRDLLLGFGSRSCSARSLQYTLGQADKGNVSILMPGGAAEAAFALPGRYKFMVNQRKGFVKVALRAGASLVPVITFGENDLYGQLRGPRLEKIQQFVKKWAGFVPVVFVGRGFFQNSIGLIPRQVALTTVVGASIDVEQVENPSQEEIERLHEVFVKALVDLFEKHKHTFLNNAENTFLELV